MPSTAGGATVGSPATSASATNNTVTDIVKRHRANPYQRRISPLTGLDPIRLADGRRREHHIQQVKWSPRIPPVWKEMAAKFHAMGDSVIGSDRCDRVIEFIANLDAAESVHPLLKLVRR